MNDWCALLLIIAFSYTKVNEDKEKARQFTTCINVGVPLPKYYGNNRSNGKRVKAENRRRCYGL